MSLDSKLVNVNILNASSLVTPFGATVQSLTYGSMALTGTLPTALSGMAALRAVDLYQNRLSVCPRVPCPVLADDSLTPALDTDDRSGPLPAEYAQLTTLTAFVASDNELSSSLPASWSALTQLSKLSLWGNKLSGAIPDWSGMISLVFTGPLTGLYLHQNAGLCLNRDGSSAATVLKCGDTPCPYLPCPTNDLLAALVADNYAVPVSGSLTPLGAAQMTFNYANRGLTGTLPAVLNAPSLQYLRLENNDCTGELPADWGTGLPKLHELRLWGHSLSGSLPPQWSAMSSLVSLNFIPGDAAVRWLSGPLPVEYSALTGLESLIGETNKLTSSLPSEWASLTALKILYLRSNALASTLPDAWQTMTALERLELSQNGLTGRVPGSWSAMTSLTTLALANNALSGPVPDLSALTGVTSLLGLAGNALLCLNQDGSSNATVAKCVAVACPMPVCQDPPCTFATSSRNSCSTTCGGGTISADVLPCFGQSTQACNTQPCYCDPDHTCPTGEQFVANAHLFACPNNVCLSAICCTAVSAGTTGAGIDTATVLGAIVVVAVVASIVGGLCLHKLGLVKHASDRKKAHVELEKDLALSKSRGSQFSGGSRRRSLSGRKSGAIGGSTSLPYKCGGCGVGLDRVAGVKPNSCPMCRAEDIVDINDVNNDGDGDGDEE